MSTATVGGGGDTSRITLLVRANCPTCVRMEDVVRQVCGTTGDRWDVVDVDAPDADPELAAEFGDVVPVTLVDGHEVASWSLSADTLRAALAAPRTDP